MTDNNRQKGNESVGQKSDGLARDIEAREALKRALQRAFQFGQTYWMQADSESYSENRKAATTHAKYNEFVEQTLEALARPAPEALGAAKGELSDAELRNALTAAANYIDTLGGDSKNARAILAKAKDQS